MSETFTEPHEPKNPPHHIGRLAAVLLVVASMALPFSKENKQPSVARPTVVSLVDQSYIDSLVRQGYTREDAGLIASLPPIYRQIYSHNAVTVNQDTALGFVAFAELCINAQYENSGDSEIVTIPLPTNTDVRLEIPSREGPQVISDTRPRFTISFNSEPGGFPTTFQFYSTLSDEKAVQAAEFMYFAAQAGTLSLVFEQMDNGERTLSVYQDKRNGWEKYLLQETLPLNPLYIPQHDV